MPNIGNNKAFTWKGPNACMCYKCGKEITQGTYNWSYNTHEKGLFSHKDCASLSYNNTPTIHVKPSQEIKIPVEAPTAAVESTPKIEPTLDITDNIKLQRKHNQTATIQKLLRLREYPFLYGAPGAGKTHLAESLAADMGLNFLCISLSNDMFKSEIMGSISPVSGAFLVTEFYECWKNGGVILFDECGLASGSFLNVLNAGLAQKELRFPNRERIKMHESTFIIFADNSNLRGNDASFPERQDAGTAFRDRLSYVEFKYDEQLEKSIILAINPTAHDLHKKVLALRQCLRDNQVLGVYASPRFAYKSAKMLGSGFNFTECIEIAMLAGCDEDTKAQVMSCVNKMTSAWGY